LDLAHVYWRAGMTEQAEAAFLEAQERFRRKGIAVLVEDVQRRLDALNS
jgi:hypothetical protein